MPSFHHHFRIAARPGLDAIRLLWLPFVMIQLAGLALVIAYFNFPPVTQICDAVAALKMRTGIVFAMVSMPIACGVVPEVFKFVSGVDRSLSRSRLGYMLHNMGLFLIAGVLIDVFYTGLGRWLGDSREVHIIASKVLIDQLIYTPFVGVPLISTSYTLRVAGYRPLTALRQIGSGWYLREVVPVLLTCWAYWFPMTILLYTLPPKVTFVYAIVASAASSVLLTAVAGRRESKLADLHA
jgi:hypothetical protein